MYMRTCLPSRPSAAARSLSLDRGFLCPFCQSLTRSASRRRLELRPLSTKVRPRLKDANIEWRPIPIGLGIAVVGAVQLYRTQVREKEPQEEEKDDVEDSPTHTPKKRKRIKPSGPWQVQVMSTLPLKGLSRLWGKFNALDIPYYLRVPGFRLYSFIFGVNLSEVSEPDLHTYRNLASFFYRSLKPGVRPLEPNNNTVLSPADGKILQFGTIEHGSIEQVKGMTYSLDSLLGIEDCVGKQEAGGLNATSSNAIQEVTEDTFKADEEFAKLNGISYTLPNLFSGPKHSKKTASTDMSTVPTASSEAEVRADLALGDGSRQSWFNPRDKAPTALYYMVIYLAPGDYHRFHSPVSWVVEKRRHFAGELYSVSPWLQRNMPGLFTLNERVVLLGRWRWGFFSMTPVGATNVGSIKINFDRELKTNSLITDTMADKQAEEASERGEPYSGFAEAQYAAASKVLGGHSLKRGEEMGGFMLGSSIVLVFEAPKGRRRSFDEGWTGEREGGWTWGIEKGQKIKYGQSIGWYDEQAK